MAVRPITTLGNSVLTAVAAPVDLSTISRSSFRTLIADMTETMIAAHGIGIAAPQVNVPLQVAIINAKDEPFVIINPRIVKHSLRSSSSEEGCLSLPGVFGMVRRPHTVTITYIDQHGTKHTRKASGLLARVFQHEIDHLNGTLFINRAKKLTRTARP